MVKRSHKSCPNMLILEALLIQDWPWDDFINKKAQWGMTCLVGQGTDYDKEDKKGEARVENSNHKLGALNHRYSREEDNAYDFNIQFRQQKRKARSETNESPFGMGKIKHLL